MTTTKEDQIRADFEKSYAGADFTISKYGGYETPYLQDLWCAWRDCAESYEKKLAEKEAEIAKAQNSDEHNFQRWQTCHEQLSEANARNAMLVDVVRACDRAFLSGYGASDCHDACVRVLSANSEAVAAWEAEKLRAANKGKEIV